jgi:multidrug resistance protein, MATE family
MPTPNSPSLWTTEARATLALALPLIMANLAQSVIHATDLIFLGRLGADELAAASLAINLFMPFILFGLGLIAAVSPMVAAERGRKLHSVRDVRRTVRQGMWLAVLLCIPCWLILWQAEPILRAMGQDAQLSRDAASFLHVLMWGLLPAFLQLALRNFVAAIERPGWATAVLFGAVFINAALGWALIFGHFGMPKMGLTGAGECAGQFVPVSGFGGSCFDGPPVSPLFDFRAFLAGGLGTVSDACRAWPPDCDHADF